jgi:hypothetical protein
MDKIGTSALPAAQKRASGKWLRAGCSEWFFLPVATGSVEERGILMVTGPARCGVQRRQPILTRPAHQIAAMPPVAFFWHTVHYSINCNEVYQINAANATCGRRRGGGSRRRRPQYLGSALPTTEQLSAAPRLRGDSE